MSENVQFEPSGGMANIDDIAKNFIELNCALVAVGWGLWGDTVKDFDFDPLHYRYGAQKFYVDKGKLRCVSVSLYIRDYYGAANLVTVSDIAIEGRVDSTELPDMDFVLDRITADDVATIINKYKDVDTVDLHIQDLEDVCEYFMHYNNKGEAVFQSRTDENRQKPNNETERRYPIHTCVYSISR